MVEIVGGDEGEVEIDRGRTWRKVGTIEVQV